MGGLDKTGSSLLAQLDIDNVLLICKLLAWRGHCKIGRGWDWIVRGARSGHCDKGTFPHPQPVIADTMLGLQNKFEPALQTLVDAVSAKFSAAFKRKPKTPLFNVMFLTDSSKIRCQVYGRSSGSQGWRRLCPVGYQNSRLIPRYRQIEGADRHSPVRRCMSSWLRCLVWGQALMFIVCSLGTFTCHDHLSHELIRDVSNTLLARWWDQPSALHLFFETEFEHDRWLSL